jgi:hypothetical protein
MGLAGPKDLDKNSFESKGEIYFGIISRNIVDPSGPKLRRCYGSTIGLL